MYERPKRDDFPTRSLWITNPEAWLQAAQREIKEWLIAKDFIEINQKSSRDRQLMMIRIEIAEIGDIFKKHGISVESSDKIAEECVDVVVYGLNHWATHYAPYDMHQNQAQEIMSRRYEAARKMPAHDEVDHDFPWRILDEMNQFLSIPALKAMGFAIMFCEDIAFRNFHDAWVAKMNVLWGRKPRHNHAAEHFPDIPSAEDWNQKQQVGWVIDKDEAETLFHGEPKAALISSSSNEPRIIVSVPPIEAGGTMVIKFRVPQTLKDGDNLTIVTVEDHEE